EGASVPDRGAVRGVLRVGEAQHPRAVHGGTEGQVTRVAVIADSHFDEHSRFEECVRLHGWIADDLRARRVDAVVHTGDVYERKSTPLERQAVADWVRRVASVAPVLVVRGNHDAVDDLPLLERLATEHRVIVEQE